MSKGNLKLFPANQVAVDMLGAGFSLDDKTLSALEAASNSPTVPRNEPVRKEIASSNSIDDLVFGAILSGKLPCIDSKGIPFPSPPRPSQAKDWFVDPSDVNTLLASAGYRHVWSPKAKRARRKTPVPPASWKHLVQQEATAMCLRLYASGANPSVSDLAKSLASWCAKKKIVTERGIPPSPGYIRTHILSSQHWKKPKKP
jgi:hypothetical protein